MKTSQSYIQARKNMTIYLYCFIVPSSLQMPRGMAGSTFSVRPCWLLSPGAISFAWNVIISALLFPPPQVPCV